MTGHVLVAPDKFKGSLSAAEVAEAVVAGLRGRMPSVAVRASPVADGGDGTVRAALATGRFEHSPVRVTGPTGRRVGAEIAVSDTTAVVELASASGLALLAPGEFDPLRASSYGTGELIAAALDAGVSEIVLGVGGSACTDGGAGMLTALGARFTDAAGNPLAPGGGGLERITGADLSGLDPRLAGVDLVLASDVDNPLCGSSGAAHVYGPQKGASSEQVRRLDGALGRFAEVIGRVTGGSSADRPGAGAAGGVGYGAMTALSARFRSGSDVVLELVDFDRDLAGAALVVTGEGALDEQTLHGKVPAAVAARAAKAGVPTVAVAGKCSLSRQRLRDGGFAAVYALAHLQPDPARSIEGAAALLHRVGEHIADDFL
ncbi:glycerate kinase [Actinopolyspora lacussalsi subsp. righensis]|uniref:Glycerate kinase n=1 Tax=Actinopolyspora righensis TaxID=995060 RepID=A0A1I7B217_9ACTN|nr:glycerate kinase [Actinopolyspora righensis]SFT81198.1 glycerate kinase [Actinopolyspora righensis]